MTELGERRADPFEPASPRPVPEFAIVGVASRSHTAAPMLVFELEASDQTGLEIYTIALNVQILIEPVRRKYDERTRELLAELFGAPDRWSNTTENFLWTQTDVLVPSFIGSTAVELPIACNYDLELAATKYFYSLPDGEAPLIFHFSGSVFYRGDLDRMQVVKVPWSCSTEYRLPIAVWKEMIERHYPGGGWIRLRSETLERLQKRKAAAGLTTFDDCVTDLLEGAE